MREQYLSNAKLMINEEAEDQMKELSIGFLGVEGEHAKHKVQKSSSTANKKAESSKSPAKQANSSNNVQLEGESSTEEFDEIEEKEVDELDVQVGGSVNLVIHKLLNEELTLRSEGLAEGMTNLLRRFGVIGIKMLQEDFYSSQQKK